MFANIIFQYFSRGGPVMWPILACALTAVAVVGERTFWWWRESLKRDLQKREEILGALENSDIDAAKKVAEGSGDPVVRMIHHSLNHVHSSRSEEHTSELQSHSFISYAVFCLKI